MEQRKGGFMWQINEVLKVESRFYRVLDINQGELIWIDIENPKALPERILELSLLAALDSGQLVRSTDPFAYLEQEDPEIGSVRFIRREENIKVLLPLLQHKGIFDASERARLIDAVVESKQVSKKTVYRLLRRYWQRGQTPNALIPDYKNSGAPGERRSATGTAKIGRAREYGKGEGTKVTPEIERLFRLTIEKHLLNQKGTKTTVAYRRFVDLFAQYFPRIPQEDYPTLRQFRYFYDREYPKAQRLKSRVKAGVYRKDVRPLSSTATSQALGPGSRYEIDATIADIYLVDHNDRQ